VRTAAQGITGLAAMPILSACAAVAADSRFLIEMTEGNRFEPGGLTIPLGGTVVWQNVGVTRHTATCDPTLAGDQTDVALPAGAVPWDSGGLHTGQTWQHTFVAPGSYLYFCRYHEEAGMLGTITVVADPGNG
ncbi:MAG: cupredoxin domain-containing protein, partial [Thermomicrobiales bacterium]